MPRKKYTKFTWGPQGELMYLHPSGRKTPVTNKPPSDPRYGNYKGQIYTVGKIDPKTGEWTHRKTVYLNGRKAGTISEPTNKRQRENVEESIRARQRREAPNARAYPGAKGPAEIRIPLTKWERRMAEAGYPINSEWQLWNDRLDRLPPREARKERRRRTRKDILSDEFATKSNIRFEKYVASLDITIEEAALKVAKKINKALPEPLKVVDPYPIRKIESEVQKTSQWPGRKIIKDIKRARTMAPKMIFRPRTGELQLDPETFGRGVKNMALYVAEVDSETYRKIQRMDNRKLAALYANNGKMVFEVYFEYGGITKTKQGAKGSERTAENARFLVSEYESRYGVL